MYTYIHHWYLNSFRHEVTLISATPINFKNNLEFSMYQANCAFDPNSKVLVPAPPKELPPPKPTNLLIEIGEQIKELPSPSRPARFKIRK